MLVQRGARRAGYEIRRLAPQEDPRTRSAADAIRLVDDRYAPWLGDAAFQRTYSAVRGHTAVDEYRAYELWELARQLAKLDVGDVIEVGVWRGGSGCLLAAACREAGLDADVFLCDTFRGVVKAGEHDPVYRGGEFADTSAELVQELARGLALPRVQVLEGMFPEDTGAAVADRRFRLAHIDVDVYRSARDATEWLWDRIVPGGVFVFDDYGFSDTDGVREYVDRHRAWPDRVVIHNLNAHGLIVKLR